MRQLENGDTKQAVTMVARSDICIVHQPHVKRGCELPAQQNLYMPFKNGLKAICHLQRVLCLFPVTQNAPSTQAYNSALPPTPPHSNTHHTFF